MQSGQASWLVRSHRSQLGQLTVSWGVAPCCTTSQSWWGVKKQPGLDGEPVPAVHAAPQRQRQRRGAVRAASARLGCRWEPPPPACCIPSKLIAASDLAHPPPVSLSLRLLICPPPPTPKSVLQPVPQPVRANIDREFRCILFGSAAVCKKCGGLAISPFLCFPLPPIVCVLF